MKKALYLVFLLLFLRSSFCYSKEVILSDNNQDDIALNLKAYIFKQPATVHDINRIVNAPDSSFEKNEYIQEINYGFKQPAAWCKVVIKNTTDHIDWILKVHQARIDSIQLYVKNSKGTLIKYAPTGHFQHIKDRPFYSAHFAHPVRIEKNETVIFYIYTERKFARHAAVLSLHQLTYYRYYDHIFAISIGVICGAILLAVLVGVVLCIFVFDKVYIFYSIYCFCFLVLILGDSGFLHAFLQDPDYQELLNNYNVISYYWIVGWHVLFTVELLSIKNHPQKWVYSLGYGMGTVFCLFAIILIFPIPDVMRWHISLWSYYLVFFTDAYILYAIIIKLFKKELVVYFYLAGFLFTMLAASILMLADLQVLEGINQKTDWFFITPLVEILCMVIGLGIHFSNHVRERLNAQIQLNETQSQIITIQEDERKRIAQDLHDDVGNSLAAVKNMLIQQKETPLIEKEVDNIIQDIRNISHDLMPVDFKEYALTDIVRHTVNKFKGHTQIGFEYDQTGDAVKLNPVTELVIYRIINELISNAIKHSQASHVLIQLIYQEESLVVMVEDNGKGIQPKNSIPKEGIGLKNIRHRVTYIQATLNIESDHKGSLIIVEIPYERNL